MCGVSFVCVRSHMHQVGVRRRLSVFLSSLLVASLLAAIIPLAGSPLVPDGT